MRIRVLRPPGGMLAGLTALVIIGLSLGPAAAEFAVPQSVVGTGGSNAVSSGFGVRGTVGQTVVFKSSAESFDAAHGYWYNPYTTVTDISDNGEQSPISHRLDQNYPNPFNPSTTIQFAIPARSHVSLVVYDVAGHRVATLVNRELDRGVYSEVFNARDLATGVYFYRLRTESFSQTRKLVILK